MLLWCLQGLLEAHESVAGHTLADLPSCSSSAAAAEVPTLLLIDTAGCNFDEQQEQDGDSRFVVLCCAVQSGCLILLWFLWALSTVWRTFWCWRKHK